MIEYGYIICVDDERVVLNALYGQLSNIINNDDIYIECFDNPIEALEFIDELFIDGEKPLIIFCDWLMPQMKGHEFMNKASKRFPDISYIMLSGFANESNVNDMKNKLNYFTFIQKPWNKSDIEKVLKISNVC